MEFEEQPIHQMITEIKGSDLPQEAKYGNYFNVLWCNLGCIRIDFKYKKCSVCNRLQSYTCYHWLFCNSLRNEFERLGQYLVTGGEQL